MAEPLGDALADGFGVGVVTVTRPVGRGSGPREDSRSATICSASSRLPAGIVARTRSCAYWDRESTGISVVALNSLSEMGPRDCETPWNTAT